MKRLAFLAALLVCSSAHARQLSVTGIVEDQSSTVKPTAQNVSTPAGETGELDITITHPDGTAYDLTGAQVLLAVGSKISRQATITDAPNGKAKFPLVIADTLAMLGTYTYDVTVTATDGSFYRVVPASNFVVTAGIGQPGQPVTVPAAQQPLAQGPQGPAGNPQTIYVAGVAQPSEPGLNFSSGVTCSNNPGASRLDCSVTGGGGSGTVTSVAMSMPAQFTVTGSPVTTSGTLAASWANQSANTLLCGPTTGAAAAPTFRSLVVADIPALPESQITNLTGDLASKAPTTRLVSTGTGLTGGGDLSADRTLSIASTVPICTPTTVGDYCGWNGSAWVREPAPGSGGGAAYVASTLQNSLGATSTTSTTFTNIGDGTTTGYPAWTNVSIPTTKTYAVFVDVEFYMTALSGGQRIYLRMLVDGAAPGGQPAVSMSGNAGTSSHRTVMFPLSLAAGTHSFQLQWKVDAGNTANLSAFYTLQYTILG